MFSVAMGKEGALEDVTLHGACGQSGGRPHALNVEDYSWNLRIISQAHKLSHERDARSGSGSHRTGPRPSGAKDHAGGGQFIFGLHHGKGGLAVGANPTLVQIINQLL